MKVQHLHQASIIFLTLILLTSCKNLKGHNEPEASEEYFKIEIVQNDEVVPISNNTVTLKKEPFKFKVTLINTEGVYVSASWEKYYFDYPDNENIFECKDKSQFEGCRFVAVKTGNQSVFNANKELLVGDGSYQWNWFYDASMDWHRFDSTVTVKDGNINAEMTVENIYDCDGRDEGLEESSYDYTIENINKEIYLVFATNHYESGMEHPEELQREKIKITFEQ